MLKRDYMLSLLDQELATDRFQDFCPNGLQVEGREQIHRVVSGVTACQALIDAAIVERGKPAGPGHEEAAPADPVAP